MNILDNIITVLYLRQQALVLLQDYVDGDTCTCEGNGECLHCKGIALLTEINEAEQGLKEA